MESLISFILVRLGYSPASLGFSSKELLDLLRQELPFHIPHIEKSMRAKGKSPQKWEELRPEMILNILYKVDQLYKIPSNKIWNLQITTNLDDIQHKRNQLRKTEALRQTVGIDLTALVIIIPPEGDWFDTPFDIKPKLQMEQIQDEILDLMCEIDENPNELEFLIDLSWVKL